MVRVIYVLVIAVFSLPLAAAGEDRPTIQDRFAPKASSFFAHATAMTHVRNDFYNTFGVGVDAGGWLNESFALEARWLWLHSSLSAQAIDIKERTGLTPDARPQDMMLMAGARLSIGYGKMLIHWGDSVVHFDPQLGLHLGMTSAENRWLPTVMPSLGFLLHFRWGIQVKLDLAVNIQVEDRARGSVTTFGFVPLLGIGWSHTLGES